MTQPYRLLVCGGRDYANQQVVDTFITGVIQGLDNVVIVHGAARGADSLAADFARRHSACEEEPWRAEWERFGRGAGPRRNEGMARSGLDYAIVFPGGRGTADMVTRLESHGVAILRVCI